MLMKQNVNNDVTKDSPILDQFSMITRPYTRPNSLKTSPFTRPNGLKTIPSPAAHTRIANIWEYHPSPRGLTVSRCKRVVEFAAKCLIMKYWKARKPFELALFVILFCSSCVIQHDCNSEFTWISKLNCLFIL